MKFSDWYEELKKLKERTDPLLVDEEVLTIDINIASINKIMVFLASDGIKFLQNGTDIRDNGVRNYYTASEKEWERALGDLRTKVTLAESLHEKLVKIAVNPYMKEVVLDRMTGVEEDIPPNDVILQMAAVRREKELIGILKMQAKDGAVRLEIPLESPSSCYELSMSVSGNMAWVYWGGKASRSEASVKENLSFLNHYSAIKEGIEKCAKVVKAAVSVSNCRR